MKVFFFFMLIIATGCSGKHYKSASKDPPNMSQAQGYLTNLKDSMLYQYALSGSISDKQAVLDQCFKKLRGYLSSDSLDSLRVTVDEVVSEGLTVYTRVHLSGIEFKSTLNFVDNMPARLDSLYKFMKSLQPGSTVLLSLAYNGECQVNIPEDTNLPTFSINAIPCPLNFGSVSN